MVFISDKFKNLIEHRSGYTWSKDKESATCQNGSFRVLTVTNVQEKLDLRSELYISGVNDRDRKRKMATKGWTIAVSSNGNRKRIGNAVFIDEDTDYLFASFLTGFIPKDQNIILPKYFFYWLSSHPIQERITSVSEGTTGLGNLDIRFLRNMDIYYPQEILEQKAITGILSKVDQAIEAVESSIKKADQLKKSLMQNLLTGKMKPDGTWRRENELFMTKYGFASKTWKYCQIKDLIKDKYIKSIQDGNHGESHPVSTDFVSEGIPFVMASDISEGYIDIKHCKKITQDRADKLRVGFAIKGDVLLSHKASVGYTCIVEEVDPYVMLTPQVTYYRVDPSKLIPEYLKLFFQTYQFQCNLEGLAKQSTRNYIGITNQKKIWIYLPDNIEEQRIIVNPIIQTEDLILCKKSKIRALQTLKKSLMQNLLTGKLRVDVEQVNTLLEEV